MRRHLYLSQATLAYQAGNKALAKELGAKGRAANEAMKAAHAAASADIFASRNAPCHRVSFTSPQTAFQQFNLQGA